MTYTEAKREFDIRLYRWAKPILLREIAEDFPSFKLCKDGPGQTCRFFRSLDLLERMNLAQGLLQRRHSAALEALREPALAAGDEMVKRLEDFMATDTESFLFKRTEADEKRLSKARKVRRAMAAHFKAAFGSACLRPDPLDKGEDLIFRMECRGWSLKTFFHFWHYGPVIAYSHDVWTGKWLFPEEPPVLPFNSLRMGTSYGNEIGIGSVWDHVTDDDIEPEVSRLKCQ